MESAELSLDLAASTTTESGERCERPTRLQPCRDHRREEQDR